MAIIREIDLTNPQIFVGTPPPYPEKQKPPMEALTPYWYTVQNTVPLDRDECSDLVDLSKDPRTYLKFHVRQYTVGDELPGFSASMQLGIISDPDISSRTDNLQSGVLIKRSGSLISAPYLPTMRRYTRNGVYKHSQNTNEENIIWQWIGDKTTTTPTEEGTVEVVPLSRRQTEVRTIELQVPECESIAGLTSFGNTEVNAFSLKLKVITGPDYISEASIASSSVKLKAQAKKPSGIVKRVKKVGRLGRTVYQTKTTLKSLGGNAKEKPTPWKVTIRFGEVTLELEEGRAEAKVTVGDRHEWVNIAPSAAQNTNTSMGDAPYELTFIPVWNGVIFSSSAPGGSQPETWAAGASYIRKNKKLRMIDELNEQYLMSFAQEDPKFGANGENQSARQVPPRFGENGENLPTYQGEHGVMIPGDTGDRYVDFGSTLTVTFERCGGAVQFCPVFFAKNVRDYIMFRGEDTPDRETPTQEPDPENCQSLPELQNTYKLPIFYYPAGDTCDRLIKVQRYPSSDPAIVISQQFSRRTDGYRRPLEKWGVTLATQNLPEKDDGGIAMEGELVFKNKEGFLRAGDLPVNRIKSVSISRSLDGSSGSIVWDRYDPIMGLYPRPPQAVGAVRVAVGGGVDVVPGVLFTGLAMGNAENASHDGNLITVPLMGREAKMTDSEGGLRVINAPYFDGYDHRAVQQWLCNFAGVPFKSWAKPYKLPAGTIYSPVVDIKTGTSVWDAIQEIAKYAANIVFFDRYGVLNTYDVGQTSPRNWTYPSYQVISYDDKPDLSQMRNSVVVAGLVTVGDVQFQEMLTQEGAGDKFQPMMLALQQQTTPKFEWSKMMFYAIPGIIQANQLKLAAAQFLKGVTRPRAAGSVTIPGNAEIELLDRFNGAWVVTGITHNVDTQAKTFQTQLNLEFLMGEDGNSNLEQGTQQGTGGGGGQLSSLGSSYDSSSGINYGDSTTGYEPGGE